MRFSLREIFISIIIFAPLFSLAQQSAHRLSDLYRYVENTDSVINKSQRTFYLEKFLKDNFNYKETWRFTTNAGKVVFFQVDYILDSTEYTEIYYVNRGNLVCSEEYEKVNYSFLEDELKWGSIYYFQSALPRHVVTLGRKQYLKNNINPELLVLNRFEKRLNELQRHMPMLP